MWEDYENDRPATPAEAVREWAWVVGQERPDSQWLLSDYDTWERNPHYTGPEQAHPESYGCDEPQGEPSHEYTWPDYTRGDSLDIPF